VNNPVNPLTGDSDLADLGRLRVVPQVASLHLLPQSLDQ
jgi:hypothetical protein